MANGKGRVFLVGAILIGAACGGQAVSSSDGGAKDGAASDGGSSGTSGTSGSTSGSSGTSGTSGTSGSTSGSSGTSSGSSGSTGQVVCLAHDVQSTGTPNNCKVTDTVQCGAAGTVNDEYEVICQCTSTLKNCDCIMNNAEITQVTVTTCPSCDPSILQGAYSKCGFPY